MICLLVALFASIWSRRRLIGQAITFYHQQKVSNSMAKLTWHGRGRGKQWATYSADSMTCISTTVHLSTRLPSFMQDARFVCGKHKIAHDPFVGSYFCIRLCYRPKPHRFLYVIKEKAHKASLTPIFRISWMRSKSGPLIMSSSYHNLQSCWTSLQIIRAPSHSPKQYGTRSHFHHLKQ